MRGAALFSADRVYRYELERTWSTEPPALFVGLNPSTADAETDDPTIRRCLGFARSWGCGGLLMGNVYAFRSTDPRALYYAEDPVGPDNDDHLEGMARKARLVVAAWGAHAAKVDPERLVAVRRLLPELQALGFTQAGHPRHPLYLRRDTPLEPMPTVVLS